MNVRISDVTDTARHYASTVHAVNDRIAERVTRGVGTMLCAYLFALLALISLPAAISTGDPIIIVAWVAQTFLQLVLLPIIIVGQRLQADSHDELHDKVDAIHDHLGING